MRIACTIVFLVGLNCSTQADESIAMIGRSTCASANCHGNSVGVGPAWNHSQTKWLIRDPHADAGLVLGEELSRQIVQRLDPESAKDAQSYGKFLRQRCISCHVTATEEDCQSEATIDRGTLALGVSCESCHGPAERWRDSHVSIDWQGSDRFRPETGMRDTESAIGLADTCVRCHVGSRREDGLVRDMNHDLIAAGHPALRFDLQLYLDRLPKHWDVNNADTGQPGDSALAFRRVGRAITLAAAASLTSQRADDHQDDSSVPWPEFADYDCFACHQSLSMEEFHVATRKRSSLHISDGLPIWNAWHSLGQVRLRENVDILTRLSPHRSNPNDVAVLCRNLAKNLRNKAESQLDVQPEPVEVIRRRRDAEPPIDWNEAATVYLELDAALKDLPTSESVRNALHDRIEPLLRFDPQSSSRDRRWNSPREFDSKSFQSSIQDLLQDF